MKTSELTGAALDWAVAKCEGHEIDSLLGGAVWYWLKCSLTGALEVVDVFHPSTNWAQGGPIIEREKLDAFWNPQVDWWSVAGWDERGKREVVIRDPSYLCAAMRCYVACKLGDTVDIPEELNT